jgi:hypothetical protein
MMLVEEVVFPFIIDHSIGIVHPHGIRAKMELGPICFLVVAALNLLVWRRGAAG